MAKGLFPPQGGSSGGVTLGQLTDGATIQNLVNAQIAAGAAIAYSKLNLGTSIVNGDIAAAAAIAYSKLASLTSAHILVGSAGNIATDTNVTGDISISNTGVTTLAATKSVVGKHDELIPAGSMWITVTNPATALARTETGTNKLNYQALSFLNGATNRVEFWWVPPREWDAGTIKATLYWLCTNASANNVTWFVSGVAIGDGSTIDAAQGTQQSVTQGNGGASILNKSAQTAAITIAGTPASGKMVQIRIERQAGDTLAFPALLLGCVIEYSITQATSA